VSVNTASGPGLWPIDWTTEAAAKVPEAARARVGPLAVLLLWAATGRRFGLVTQTHTVHPGTPAWPCTPGDGWGILLPGPVYDIVQVVGGTTTYATTDYRMRGDVLLRSTRQPWPDQTTVVTYRRGRKVPFGGDTMAGTLAAELHVASSGGKCRLPARATRVSREGIDVDIADPMDYLAAGLTGIPDVDAWISALNPHRLKTDSIAWSPDIDPGAQRYAPPVLRPVRLHRLGPGSGW
jgi:hypothetical protein